MRQDFLCTFIKIIVEIYFVSCAQKVFLIQFFNIAILFSFWGTFQKKIGMFHSELIPEDTVTFAFKNIIYFSLPLENTYCGTVLYN